MSKQPADPGPAPQRPPDRGPRHPQPTRPGEGPFVPPDPPPLPPDHPARGGTS